MLGQGREGSNALKRSFYKLFFSVSLVLLIPLSVVLLSFSFGLRDTVLEDYLALNSQIVENVSRTIDTAITSQTNYAYSLRDNMLLRQLSANLIENRIAMQEVCLELSDYLRTILFNNISYMTALYFPTLDLVVSSDVKNVSFKDYYERYVCYDGMSADAFRETFDDIEQYYYWPGALCSPINSGYRSAIIYAQPINMGYLMPRAYYITFIEENAVVNLVGSSFEGSVSFILFDASGRELMRTAGIEDAWRENALNMAEASTIRSSSGGSYRLFRTQLLSSGLQFVFYVPESSVMMRINRFILIYIIALAGSLVLGLLIANRFARRLHTPYENLLSAVFPEGASLRNGTMKEGFGIVAERIREEQMLNRQFQQELHAYYSTERDKTLLFLMTHCSALSRDELQEAAEICGLPISHSAYQVALLRTDAEDIDILPLAADDDAGNAIFVVRLSRYQFLAMAAFPSETQSPLPALLESLQNQFRTGCSQIHGSLYDLPLCLDEADANLHPRTDAPNEYAEGEACYYPIDQELQIITAVRDGQFGEVSRLMNDIRRYNQQTRPDSTPALNEAMLSTAFKLADELPPEQRKAVEAGMQRAQQVERVNSGSLLYFTELLALYRQLCGFMSSSMHDKNQSIIENVRKYLGEHYTDPSLCLDSVAEHLGVSYYFLSRIFKAEANQSFSDMLNDTRIYRAMDLLHSTDLPVQSISEQVGYTNWSTFLRAFKKRTDLTPLQYRKNHA